ncbi:MAG: flagellar biosynthetic protein FliQ [Candidatus Syntrophopropionicum ammoniitolerans]
MTQTFVIHLAREALLMTLALAGPVMAVALSIGLIISILQAATQVQDQMLNMAAKILGVFLVLMLLGAWMLNIAISFTTNLFTQIPSIVR